MLENKKIKEEIQVTIDCTTNSEKAGEKIYNEFIQPGINKIKELESQLKIYKDTHSQLSFMLRSKLKSYGK